MSQIAPMPYADTRDGSSSVFSTAHVGVIRTLAIALLLTVGQLTWSMILALRSTPAESYLALAYWDSRIFAGVAEVGYAMPENQVVEKHITVAFFPGLPLLARSISWLTGLGSMPAVLLASQLSTWMFWSYFLLLLHRWGLPARRQRWLVLFLICQPACFFLVCGYSESLFLACLMGMIYWTDRGDVLGEWIGALHGFVLSATRFVGIVLACYPVLRWLALRSLRQDEQGRLRWGRLASLLGCSLLTTLGVGIFFTVCWANTGRWDAYFLVQKAGWHIQADYLFLLKRSTYLPRPVLHFTLGPDWVSQVFVIGFIAGFAFLGWQAWQSTRNSGWSRTGEWIILLVPAFFLFYVSAAAKSTQYMNGMIRFALPVLALLALALALRWRMNSLAEFSSRAERFHFAGCLASFLLQTYYLYRYTHALWVA